MPVALNPEEMKVQDAGKFRMKVAVAKDKDDDHPTIREIRRRLMDTVLDMAECEII